MSRTLQGVLQWAFSFSSQPDKNVQDEVIAALRAPDITQAKIMDRKGNEAQAAFKAMQQLHDDKEFWESSNLKPSSLFPVMTRLARVSGEIPKFIFVKLDNTALEQVGGGYFGVIYKGKFQSHQDVAVKCLRDTGDGYWDIHREALAFCNLVHPNVLQLIGIANMKLERQPAIITPWLPKRNIVDCIASSNPDFAQRIQWLFGIAQGVDYLHENKVIHGDLKGLNILIDNENHPRIADFGLAVFDGNWSKIFGSNRGGTLRWQAPEHLTEENDTPLRPAPSGDVYSFAMVFIEVITGRKPFSDIQNEWRLRKLISSGQRPEKPSNLPDNMYAHLEGWWHQDPHQRPSMSHIVTKFFPNPELPPGDQSSHVLTDE